VRVSRGEQVLTHLGQGEHVGEMALIRSVPRSATVAAVGPAEVIAIRRADFFEILRKEHEVAVKMLWQFLGVLADRLDQTNSQLHNAKRELAAEDITADIFPVDVDEIPASSPNTTR
jgi:CRP-like cAMP-binding protein